MHEVPAAETLLEILTRAAAAWPARTAVIDSERMLSYGALVAEVEALAARLSGLGEPGDAVGVRLGCSVDTVVAYFACLRAGRLYTPIAATDGPELDGLVRRLGLVAMVCGTTLPTAVPQLHPLQEGAGRAAPARRDPAAPAHLLLTSGTSGPPKAVLTDQLGSLLSHRWRSTLAPFRADDVVGCNVFGIWDVVPALEHGVPVVMIPDAALRDPLALAGLLVRHGVTRLMLTPTLLGACLAAPRAVAALSRLRLIVLCGETARPAMLRTALARLPDTRLLNLYSTSECHDVAAGFVEAPDSGLQPAPFATLRLVDPDDRERPAPVNESGRLLVGGAGVALGYLDGESRGFFRADGVRWFDTGDLAVRHSDGAIRIVGRADARAKVRGRWVDPAQVASVLAEHPEVLDVAVTVEDGRVVARVASHRRDLPLRLRSYARTRLPAHTIPARIDVTPRLGVASSGKAARARDAAAAEEPGDELTPRVLAAFRSVLGDAGIRDDQDFTALGGDSIDAIELAGRLQTLSSRLLNVGDVLRHGTPRRLAGLLAGAPQTDEETWRLPPAPRGPAPRLRAVREAAADLTLLTGASGHLGAALAQRIGANRLDLRRPELDLERPDLGLTATEFDALAGRLGRIVHAAARMDAFGGFEAHYRTNVQGLLTLIRLAWVNGAPIHHVSSSAVLPLGAAGIWTPDRAPSEALAGELRASGADSYSYTKLGAELALWRAGAAGLPVRIVRVPHLLGHPGKDRLVQTLRALRAAGVYPEGEWRWQFVLREPVADAVLAAPAGGQEIVHVALPPVALADLVRYLDLDLRPVPLAAMATALARVDPAHPDAAQAKVLALLVAQFGPAAALSLKDAMLNDQGGEPRAVFAEVFEPFR